MARPKQPSTDSGLNGTVGTARADDKRGRRRDDHNTAGMGGGIAGPAEPGAAGTAGGGTTVGGETAVTSVPTGSSKRR
jgi:hypothetical protein